MSTPLPPPLGSQPSAPRPQFQPPPPSLEQAASVSARPPDSPMSGTPVPSAGGSAASAARLLVVIGAVVVGISIFMVWGTDDIFERSRSANEVPLQLLWDTTPATFDSLAVRWPLLIGAILMLGGAFKAQVRLAALIGSLIALVTALLYVNGIRAVHSDDLYDIEGGLTDSIGTGTWVCVAGAVIGVVGGIILMSRGGRRASF